MDHQPEHDEGVGDAKLVRKRQKKEQLEREREQEEIRAMLKYPGNRAFLWRLLEYCRVYHSNPYPDNHGSMAMFEGRRMVGVWILQQLAEADPSAYARMRDEATEKQKRLTT